MAIGTPAIVGSFASASASGTIAIASTTGAIATHDLVLVNHYAAGTTGTGASMTDDSGNTYALCYRSNNTGSTIEMWACFDAIAMTTTHAVTMTVNGAAARHGLFAINATGMLRTQGCYDVHTGTQHERATETTFTETVLNGAANQMLIVGFVNGASVALTSFAAGTGFTALTPVTSVATCYPVYQIVAASTPISWTPSWSNSASIVAMSGGFVGTPATTVSQGQPSLSLMGVG